jgi:hypothetical protein
MKQRLLAKAESTRTFAHDYDSLHALLAIRTLSIPNCRWCARSIAIIRSRYTATLHGQLLDNLDLKLSAAFTRAEDRAAGRKELRQKKRGPKPLTNLPPLPEADDPWSGIDTSFLETDLADELDAAEKAEAQ